MKVALVIGGISAEREVSLLSGKAMLNALIELGVDYKIIDPALGSIQPEKESDFFELIENPGDSRKYIECIQSELFDDVDVALLGLHGHYGEDGKIQALLEMRKIKYTGSGVLSSALAMDKSLSKVMFQHFNVATPKWFLINKRDFDVKLISQKVEKFFGYPCIVKPNQQGSTFGLTVCENSGMLEDAINFAFQYDSAVFAEEYINGRELTVGVLENRAFPVLEIKPKHKLYDYECKYTAGMTEYFVPADLPEKVSRQIRQQALLAFHSVGCAHYGRVDFMLNENNESFCLEVNTLPGMTGHSLLPKMAAAEGISFPQLVKKIIELAM